MLDPGRSDLLIYMTWIMGVFDFLFLIVFLFASDISRMEIRGYPDTRRSYKQRAGLQTFECRNRRYSHVQLSALENIVTMRRYH